MIHRRKVIDIPEFYAGERPVRGFYILIVRWLLVLRRYHICTHINIW